MKRNYCHKCSKKGSKAEKRRIGREWDKEERQQERRKESGKKEVTKREEGRL
jgi:hypothetical protein